MQLRFSTLFVLLLSAMVSVSAWAQDPLDDVYGHAVHAYFRGDAATAQQWLNEAIAAGSQDPRAYYYRGLCQAALSSDQRQEPAILSKLPRWKSMARRWSMWAKLWSESKAQSAVRSRRFGAKPDWLRVASTWKCKGSGTSKAFAMERLSPPRLRMHRHDLYLRSATHLAMGRT